MGMSLGQLLTRIEPTLSLRTNATRYEPFENWIQVFGSKLLKPNQRFVAVVSKMQKLLSLAQPSATNAETANAVQ